MLRQIGLRFKVIPAHVDEDYKKGELPKEHVERLAKKKAEKVAALYPDSWILGADTIVVLDGNILGKPEGKADAKKMLNLLNDRVHEVYTGYYIKNNVKQKSVFDFVVSKVKIKKLSKQEIEFYINTDEPYDKAGGYAVQGTGAFMVEEITGSYTNVVGLPLCQVIDYMQSIGIIKLF
jgi:septum formation protein